MHYVILVADDEEDVDSIKEGFKGHYKSVDIVMMNSGRALDGFLSSRSQQEFPFLIIVEHNLRHSNFNSIISSLKRSNNYKRIPVVVMSGFATESAIRQLYLDGVNCFYRKPMNLDEWDQFAECLLILFHESN